MEPVKLENETILSKLEKWSTLTRLTLHTLIHNLTKEKFFPVIVIIESRAHFAFVVNLKGETKTIYLAALEDKVISLRFVNLHALLVNFTVDRN